MGIFTDGVECPRVDGVRYSVVSGNQINLCPNGSFEHWCAGYTSSDNETPTFWFTYGAPRVVERDDGEWDGYEGCYSVKVCAHNTVSSYGIRTYIHNLKPSTMYQVAARVQVSSGFRARIAVQSSASFSRMISPDGVTGVWHDINGRFVTAASGGASGVVMVLQCQAVSHCVWWDRVTVFEGDVPITSYMYTPCRTITTHTVSDNGSLVSGGFSSSYIGRIDLPRRCVVGDFVTSVLAFPDRSGLQVKLTKNSLTSTMLNATVTISGTTGGGTPSPYFSYKTRGSVKQDVNQCEAGDTLWVYAGLTSSAYRDPGSSLVVSVYTM